MNDKSRKLGFGNLLAIATALISAGIVYGQTEARIDGVEMELAQYEDEIIPLLQGLEKEISEIKVEQAKIATDILWLKHNASAFKE